MFTHLHVHTEFSLLDGVTRIPELVAKVKEKGMKACAITDHGSMYGVFRFYNEMKHEELKPILGCEIYIAPRTRFDKESGVDNKYFHMTILAQNLQGYKNLMKIVSVGHMEGYYYKPRVDWETLEKYNEGIIVLSGCLSGVVSKPLREGKYKEALAVAKKYSELFKGRYFIEIQKNGVDEQEQINPDLIKIARELDLPIVATCDSHFLTSEDSQIQEVVWAIADGKTMDDPTRRVPASSEFYIKSPEEMEELFKDLPEAVENTQKIVDMIEDFDITFGRVEPPYLDLPDGKTSKEHIRDLVYKGAQRKYKEITKEISDRIDYELDLIDSKGYNNYFLLVYDFVKYCVEHNIMAGARGSAVGTVVGYCLDIAGIDPIKWGLYFERFLNPGRNSPPDIDLDISDQRRGDLIKYAQEKYGEANVRQIITFSKLQTRQAIRDVSRVLGIDLTVANQLSKMVKVDFGKAKSIDYMIENNKDFAEIINSNPQHLEMVKIVKKVAGLARGVSTHACGVIVAPKPIEEYVPIQRDAKGEGIGISQYVFSDIEYVGLLKMDFLGLKNLNIIDTALIKIKRHKGINVNLFDIDVNDQNVYQSLQEGHTVGIFQLESEGITKALISIRPENPEDLCYILAAYRPGPIAFIPEYSAVKKGEKKAEYIIDDLRPILEVTNGVITYQEQVMRIATDISGYTLTEADNMRRAMGKKIMELMLEEREKLVQGAIARGYPEKEVNQLGDMIVKFANYGFNKSHAAAYAMVSYYTAYLKYHYPMEYMAALLEADLENFDRITIEIQECNRLGIQVAPPNINKSGLYFTVEAEDEGSKIIRFGMGAIKNVGQEIVEQIVKERTENGLYKHLDDFIYRNIPHKLQQRVVEYLIMAGTMDEFGDRNGLIAILPKLYEKFKKQKKTEENGQMDFFSMSTNSGSSTDEATSSVDIPATPVPTDHPTPTHQKLQWEKELLGFFISSHPLDPLKEFFAEKGCVDIKEALKQPNMRLVALGAIITKIKRITTKKGDQMAFLTAEDKTGNADILVFPNAYQEMKNSFEENKPMLIAGKISERDGTKSIILEKAMLVDQTKFATEFKGVIYKIGSKHKQKDIDALKAFIKDNPGETAVKIVIKNKEGVKTVNLKQGIEYNEQAKEFLKIFA